MFDPARALFLTTALDYTSYGGEIEMAARPAANLDLLGGLGYTHATLDNVPPASLTGARSGNDVPNVPGFTTNLRMRYRLEGDRIHLPGDFVGQTTYHYTAARAADVASTFDLASYDILNLRLTWQNDGLGIHAFANNLFDKRYEGWGQSFGGVPTVRVGQGRVLGIGTSLQF